MYRCIKYHPTELKNELSYVIPAREIFADFKEQISIDGLTDIQRTVKYLYLIKTSFGCTKSSYATRPKNFDNTLKRFDEINERLKNVSVENKDFEGLIKLYDSDETLFYLDPPYYKTEKYYKNGHQFTEYDHFRLCELLKNIKGKFILSYNDNDFIRELYKNFKFKEVIRKNTLSASNNAKNFKELIIKNF